MATRLELPKFQAFDSDGDPLVGGLLYTYIVGTSTPKATYTDATAGTEQANPIVLNSRGEADSDIYGDGYYKLVLKTSAEVTIYTIDSICGVNESTFTTIGDYSGDLDAAITAIGATATHLFIDSAATMSTNTTVPATCAITVLKGGTINQSTYTLTLNGPFEAGPYQVFTGTGTVNINAGGDVWADWFGSGKNDTTLASMKTMLGSSNQYDIKFSSQTWSIENDITITDNFDLVVPQGATFSITAAKAFDIDCAITAGPYQIFSGSGTVTGDPIVERTIPEWWGAIGDGTTEDYDAVYAALTHWYQRALPGKFQFLPGKNYLVSTAISITLTKNLQGAWTIDGYGSKITSGVTSDTFFTLTTPSSGSQHFNFRGLEIYGSGDADNLLTLNGGDDAAKYFYGCSFRDIYLVNFEGNGLSILGNFFESSIESVHARGKSTNTTGYGIYAYNGAAAVGTVSSVTLRNCVTDYGYYGIYVKSPTGDVKAENCTSIRAQYEGIFLESNFGTHVLNCHVEANYQSAGSTAQGQAGLRVTGSGTISGVQGTGDYQANVVRVYASAGDNIVIIEGTMFDPGTHYAYLDGGALAYITYIGNYDVWINDDDPNFSFSRIGYTYKDLEVASNSGTGEDTLATYSLPDDNLAKTECIRVTAFGTKSGANGNKTLKFYFGSTSCTFHAAANNTNDWRFEAVIANYRDDTQQVLSWVGYDGGTLLQGLEEPSEDTTGGAITIKITGECAHADDLIYIKGFILERF